MEDVVLADVTSPEHLTQARTLFEEYAASIGFSLEFQRFDHELAALPGRYAPPRGAIVLAFVGNALAGCLAMRPLEGGRCEMKRMFVRPSFHGRGLGRRLGEAILARARTAGYTAMRLDTVASMQPALKLYASLGFEDIAPYTENPIQGARFLEVDLR